MDNFDKLGKFLRGQFHISRKLVIRRIKMSDHGSTAINSAESRITISINRDDDEGVQWDTLVHEYAHALEYDKEGNHTEQWGRIYSKCYRAWCIWDAKPERDQ